MNSFVRHEFEVGVKIDQIWDKIAAVPEWPVWAYYVRDVSIQPEGNVNMGSKGKLALRGMPRVMKYQVTDHRLYKHWTLTGKLLFMTLSISHSFERVSDDRTRVIIEANAEGWGKVLFGGFVRSRLNRNIETSIPDLIWQMEN